MLSITIICVGKLKEKWLIDGSSEYEKRLSSTIKLMIVELPEERLPEKPTQGDLAATLKKEQALIADVMPKGAFSVALCIEGERLSSELLAQRIEQLQSSGISKLCFVIGGSYGLSSEMKASCDLRLSMSDMTFPHHMARVMLLEQLYRAFSIGKGMKYHK